MKMVTVTAVSLFGLLSSLCCLAQGDAFKPSFSAKLDSANGHLLLSQCSRETPQVSGYWTLQQSDIDNLEGNLSNLDTVTARGCCAVGLSVGSLRRFGLQYAGVMIKGRKYIYINSFPFGMLKDEQERDQNFDPSKQPIAVCDGGAGFWGVLYDVETREFSQLSFNGVG